MACQKDVRITKTAYFDLIYPVASRKSATILFDQADALYEELAEEYGMKHLVRMPVVISPAQDELNAYYSSAPFSHIVIYDTVADEDMILFTDQFINIFRHELVHFVTYNLHNDFWYGLERVLGDTYNPAIVTTTMGFAEGAAVATESDFGEGRIHSDFHKRIVRQAKIEGKFPKYSEIQGSRDAYSTGNYSYYFGGAFCDYLQKKYGIEKFAEFWYRCANFKTLFYFACFKKVYGVSIKAVWKDFYDSIEIPNVPSSPDSEDWCKPLFTEKRDVKKQEAEKQGKVKKVRLKKSKRPFLDFPILLKDGVACYNALSSDVMRSELKEDGSFSTPKHLFSQRNVSRLSASSDGEFIAASYTSYSGRVPKKYVRIYHTKTHRSLYMNQPSLRDASVFSSNGNYYVAAVKTHSQNCVLEVYALKTEENGSAKSDTLVFCEELDFGDIALSPTGSENGVYFIKKSGRTYSIEHRNFLNGEKSFVVIPENSVPISLTVCFAEQNERDAEKKQERLALSFTEKGTMPRLALLGMDFDRNNASFRFSETDSSGGICNPVYIGEARFAYSAWFLEEKRIFIADAAKQTFYSKSMPIVKIDQDRSVAVKKNTAAFEKTGSAVSVGEDQIAKDVEYDKTANSCEHLEYAKSTEQSLFGEKKFSAVAYQFTGPHGTFIPFSIARSFGIKSTADSLGSSIVPFGITYITSSPWTVPIFALSGGYSPFTNSGAIYALLYGGTYITNLFTYQMSANVEFDGDGYKQSSGEIALSSRIDLRGRLYIRLYEDFHIFEGRQSLLEANNIIDYFNPAKWLNLFTVEDKTQRLFQSNKTSFTIGNIKTIGRGYYDNNGFDFSLIYDQCYSSRLSKPCKTYYSYHNFSVDIRAKNSTLIPLFAEVILFPSKDFFLGVRTDAVLFSYEIQKSTNFFPIIYANRISISLYYQGSFAHDYGEMPVSWGIFKLPDYFNYVKSGDFLYFDEAALTASFFFTPNFGGLARSLFQMKVTGTFFVRPNPLPTQKKVGFSLGFSIL